MKILLVYPRNPDTFWSFRHALKFIGREASFPPLGLLTVAAMLPPSWQMRLADLNVRPLTDKELLWADYVFISAMTVQRESALKVIERCLKLGVKTVAGGPLFLAHQEAFPEVDHLVLGEGELTFPPFLADLARGVAGHLYQEAGLADLSKTPIPLWDLINVNDYAAMNIQYGRGCPFDCEFCDITSRFGKEPRSKSAKQVVAELDALYARNWRGSIFFVDDNFIGDKKKLKREILPALIQWMVARNYPFYFYTEASINLADDPELMELMVRAGFQEVFIGIETPHAEGLAETGKVQNGKRDLLASVRKVQQAGLQVHGGFIVGFDSDPPSIFDMQIGFIQESGIATAMVGVLSALRGTKLYQRLSREGRLLGDASGNNTAIDLNFVTRMEPRALITGYLNILRTIYAPRNYYPRVFNLLKEYRPLQLGKYRIQRGYCGALVKSMLFLGVLGKERYQYWRLFVWSLVKKPRLFPLAITYAIYGFHFRKVSEKIGADGTFDS